MLAFLNSASVPTTDKTGVVKIICVYPIFFTVRGVGRNLATLVLLFQMNFRWLIRFIHSWPHLISLHFSFPKQQQQKHPTLAALLGGVGIVMPVLQVEELKSR